MPQKRGYGWIFNRPLDTDPKRIFNANAQLPSSIDLRPNCPPIYDQGQLGSCTSNAVAGAYQFDEMKNGIDGGLQPSRLFIYYVERSIEGTTATDSGAMISDGISAVTNIGICPEFVPDINPKGIQAESCWPYDVRQYATVPPNMCYAFAKYYHDIKSEQINQDIVQFKTALNEGYPITFGFTVYESFEYPSVAETGICPYPNVVTEQIIGGHAVLIVGYDDDFTINGVNGAFLMRNSWGTKWGIAGYFWMPYTYAMSSLAGDFWIITSVVEPK
jgi:C1A family cysteine protease